MFDDTQFYFATRNSYWRQISRKSTPNISRAYIRKWVEPRLARGERLEDASNARPEIRTVIDRAQRFLGLATLLTVVLAAVAVALAARRYMQRHLDACAVMRCLGITQSGLIRLHAGLFVWLALLSALLGCLLGFAAHFVLVAWLADLLALRLPAAGWRPLAEGGAVAAVLLFGFAFPPLLQLSKVPTLRVLRRELGPPKPSLLGGYALGIAALAGLLLLVAGDLRLGAYAIGGFAGALAAFWLLARLALRLVAGLRRGGIGWRQGLASLERHAAANTLQIVALALGLMAMLLLTVTRGELLAAWQKATPADAPNRFIINIQPEQRQPVAEALAAAGIEAELSPMVRGRLMRIDGHPVSAASYPDDERAQRLIEREFNLSWRADAPPGNRITAGRWFATEDAGKGLASVEEGLAKTLGIRTGDELAFVIAGQETRVHVSSLRKLDWDSMRVNFFVLTPPGVLDGAPASYITSFHLAADQATLAQDLVARFPNLTLIDVAAILAQIQAIMGQVARAVQFIFLFTLLAGAVVLVSALLTAFDERRYELSVMRALGAGRAQLRQSLLAELAVVGAIAGLIAAAGAAVVGQLLARNVFQLEMPLDVWLFPLATLAGALTELLPTPVDSVLSWTASHAGAPYLLTWTEGAVAHYAYLQPVNVTYSGHAENAVSWRIIAGHDKNGTARVMYLRDVNNRNLTGAISGGAWLGFGMSGTYDPEGPPLADPPAEVPGFPPMPGAGTYTFTGGVASGEYMGVVADPAAYFNINPLSATGSFTDTVDRALRIVDESGTVIHEWTDSGMLADFPLALSWKRLTNNVASIELGGQSIARVGPGAVDATVMSLPVYATFDHRAGVVHSSASPVGIV